MQHTVLCMLEVSDLQQQHLFPLVIPAAARWWGKMGCGVQQRQHDYLSMEFCAYIYRGGQARVSGFVHENNGFSWETPILGWQEGSVSWSRVLISYR